MRMTSALTALSMSALRKLENYNLTFASAKTVLRKYPAFARSSSCWLSHASPCHVPVCLLVRRTLSNTYFPGAVVSQRHGYSRGCSTARQCSTLHSSDSRDTANVTSGHGTRTDAMSDSNWDVRWQALIDVLQAKGFSDGDSTSQGRTEWGAYKRAILSFARAAGDDALGRLNCLADVTKLTVTPITYTDRKVKNARLRLIRFTGAAPAAASLDSPMSAPPAALSARDGGAPGRRAAMESSSGSGDIGKASFQDVCRLLMAIQLEGSARSPETETAGSRVLQHVCQLIRDSPEAVPATMPLEHTEDLPSGVSSKIEYWQPPGASGGVGALAKRKGKSKRPKRTGSDRSAGPINGSRLRHGVPAKARWRRAEDIPSDSPA